MIRKSSLKKPRILFALNLSELLHQVPIRDEHGESLQEICHHLKFSTEKCSVDQKIVPLKSFQPTF